MGADTAFVLFVIFIFIMIFVPLLLVWYYSEHLPKQKWEELQRKANIEEAKRKRQEQERIEKLRSEADFEFRSLMVESIKNAASEMGLKITNIFYDNTGQFQVGKIEGFIDESPKGVEDTVDKLFKTASDDFFSNKLKDLIETNPKYFGINFYLDGRRAEPYGDNLIIKYLKKHFMDKRIELSSYIKRKTFTKKQRDYIFRRDNYTCQMCGHFSPEGWFLEIDHVHPIRYGGSNRPDNLQTLCETCNRRKGAKIIET
jgi:hypothetical protein